MAGVCLGCMRLIHKINRFPVNVTFFAGADWVLDISKRRCWCCKCANRDSPKSGWVEIPLTSAYCLQPESGQIYHYYLATIKDVHRMMMEGELRKNLNVFNFSIA